MVTQVSMDKKVPLFGASTAAHAINLHKALTIPVVLAFMWYHNNWTQPALMYLMLHGTYGLSWLAKHANFRDKNFDAPMSFGTCLAVFLYVDLYWLGPFLLTKYRRDDILPAWEMVATLALFVSGYFLHFVADAQKYFALDRKGRHLISDGLFTWVRNPNYLGETLLYMGFCLLTRSYVAWGVLLWFIATVFIPNMRKKDASLEKYEQFKAYKARSWMMIPFVF